MADTTKFVNLETFQWSRPGAENPRLAAAIDSDDTTLTFTHAPKDEDGTVITGNFLMGVKNINGYTETIYVPAAGMSVDGLTATGCVRGIGTAGLDYNTTVSGLTAEHEEDSPVFCNVSAINFTMMVNSLLGNIDSGGENWRIGNQVDNDIKIYIANGDANEPYWGYDEATDQFIFANDGVSSTPFGTGAGVTGGDGISVTAGDIDIDLADTVIFRDSRNGNEARAPITLAASGLLNVNFMPTNVQEADTFFGATDLSAAEAETLSDGSNADALHVHAASGAFHAETYSKTINATGNFDQTITTGFEAKGIIIDYYFPIAGSTPQYSKGKAVFAGSTAKYISGFRNVAAGNITTTSSQIEVINTFQSSGMDNHAFTMSIQSLGATSFVIRIANVKTNVPGDWNALIGVTAFA